MANTVEQVTKVSLDDSNTRVTELRKYGNTNLAQDPTYLNWNSLEDGNIDTRLFYANSRDDDDWNECRWNPNNKNLFRAYVTSGVTNMPICYTTEALKYAQTGYMVSIMCTQWAVYIICKTRRQSITT